MNKSISETDENLQDDTKKSTSQKEPIVENISPPISPNIPVTTSEKSDTEDENDGDKVGDLAQSTSKLDKYRTRLN